MHEHPRDGTELQITHARAGQLAVHHSGGKRTRAEHSRGGRQAAQRFRRRDSGAVI
jgi:hypothetical protein